MVLTLVGFAIGVLALPFLALGWYLTALVVILLNRLLDGLDGALARRRGLTRRGRLSRIFSLDFLFYALVPFGFILAAPEQNALAGRLAAGLRLSVRAAVFSPLLHWQQNIRLITPVMHISRFTIWGD
ncbi:cytochrome oxidase [Escherichia coli]|uniref:Cytochrome oxidase n=1 Tax=Escherichia coli TaxID=562 RepID=A0A376SA18_ECOLX|nr:cytochrome oxidase [Escherichia coli]